jgi:hypothetical protein
MRIALLSFVGLMLTTTATLAQTETVQKQPNWATRLFTKTAISGNAPARVTDTDQGMTVDFGPVQHGTVLHYRLELKNIYAVPLKLSTRAGCNCLTATPSVDVLGKEAVGYIDVTMNTAVYTGPRTKPIYFTVSGSDKDGNEYLSNATLMMSATSRADIVCNPQQSNFGVVGKGQPANPQQFDVEYAGVQDWRLTGVAKMDGPFDVTFKELYREPGRKAGYRVTVRLKPDAPPGSLREEIQLKTNDPSSPILPYLVEASVQASLSVVPEILNFGHPKPGETLEKIVMVRGAAPFRVISVEGQGEGVVAETKSTAAQVQIIRIKYEPSKAGELNKKLKIKTDMGQEQPLIVTLQATVE